MPDPTPQTERTAKTCRPAVPAALGIAAPVAANLAMLGWAYWADAGLGLVMVFYWIESIALGIGAALRMILTQPQDPEQQRRSRATKLVLIPFFCIHYGAFALAHGIVLILLLSEFQMVIWSDALIVSLPVMMLAMVALYGLALPLVDRAQGLLTAPPPDYVVGVYGRVAVLHIGVMGAGFLVGLSGQAHAFTFVAVFMIAKIVAETGLLRRRAARAEKPATG